MPRPPPIWRRESPLPEPDGNKLLAGPDPVPTPGFFASEGQFQAGVGEEIPGPQDRRSERPYWRYDGPLLSPGAGLSSIANPDFPWQARRRLVPALRRRAVKAAWIPLEAERVQDIDNRRVFRPARRRGLAVRSVLPADDIPRALRARRASASSRRSRPAFIFLPQAPPNAWQHPSSWRVLSRRIWVWRRARMHHEPALMPQQAVTPNPDITEFVRSIRRRLLPSRRGRLLEPPWGQAVAAVVPFVDWWRRRLGSRLALRVRRRRALIVPDQGWPTRRRRPTRAGQLRRGRLVLTPAIAVVVIPGFLPVVIQRQRGVRLIRIRRAGRWWGPALVVAVTVVDVRSVASYSSRSWSVGDHDFPVYTTDAEDWEADPTGSFDSSPSSGAEHDKAADVDAE